MKPLEERVSIITNALNEMLESAGFNLVLEPEGSDFNIYTQITEVTYPVGGKSIM
jgi:hypothetical protein